MPSSRPASSPTAPGAQRCRSLQTCCAGPASTTPVSAAIIAQKHVRLCYRSETWGGGRVRVFSLPVPADVLCRAGFYCTNHVFKRICGTFRTSVFGWVGPLLSSCSLSLCLAPDITGVIPSIFTFALVLLLRPSAMQDQLKIACGFAWEYRPVW